MGLSSWLTAVGSGVSKSESATLWQHGAMFTLVVVDNKAAWSLLMAVMCLNVVGGLGARASSALDG